MLLQAYDHDRDAETAAGRIEAIVNASLEVRTPEEQVEEIANNARAFALVGRTVRSRELLRNLHSETLGYARAPGKDPQYLFGVMYSCVRAMRILHAGKGASYL